MNKKFQNVINVLFSVLVVDIVMSCIYFLFCDDPDNWDTSHDIKNVTFLNKYFNHFYYSTMVSTTVGIGPISPKSNLVKLLTLFHVYITFAILPFALG